jgi:serine/threonine protein kinase
MEFLHGVDAGRVMRVGHQRHKPLPFEHAINIALGACAGLHYAHEKTVDGEPLHLVHRDVSPSNLFVTYDGHVKVVDFGIAKAASRESKTKFGTLKGKVAYMSPEQVRSQPLDRRSDVFALGVVLWELTTGRRLFKRDNDFDTLKVILEQDAPRPSSVVSGYPPELEAIVMKALRRPRGERHQTVEELQLELEAFARERKLVISPVALGRYLRDLFFDVLDEWERAQRQGKDLGTHLAEVGDPSFVDDSDSDLPGTHTEWQQGTPVQAPEPAALPAPTRITPSSAPTARRPPMLRALAWSLPIGAIAAAAGWFALRGRPAVEETARSTPEAAAPAARTSIAPEAPRPPTAPPEDPPPPAAKHTRGGSRHKIGHHAAPAPAASPPRDRTPAPAPDPDAPMTLTR